MEPVSFWIHAADAGERSALARLTTTTERAASSAVAADKIVKGRQYHARSRRRSLLEKRADVAIGTASMLALAAPGSTSPSSSLTSSASSHARPHRGQRAAHGETVSPHSEHCSTVCNLARPARTVRGTRNSQLNPAFPRDPTGRMPVWRPRSRRWGRESRCARVEPMASYRSAQAPILSRFRLQNFDLLKAETGRPTRRTRQLPCSALIDRRSLATSDVTVVPATLQEHRRAPARPDLHRRGASPENPAARSGPSPRLGSGLEIRASRLCTFGQVMETGPSGAPKVVESRSGPGPVGKGGGRGAVSSSVGRCATRHAGRGLLGVVVGP